MKHLIAIVFTGVATLSGAIFPASAKPINDFEFVQTSSVLPTFHVDHAFIAIRGGFGDLPTIDSFNNPGPNKFGNLIWFSIDISYPGRTLHYSLDDFIEPCLPTVPGLYCDNGALLDFPDWRISRRGISFIDLADANEFIIDGFRGVSTIDFYTDVPDDCYVNGTCRATGFWSGPSPAEVPEPATLALVGFGLLGLARMRGLTTRKPAGQP